MDNHPTVINDAGFDFDFFPAIARVIKTRSKSISILLFLGLVTTLLITFQDYKSKNGIINYYIEFTLKGTYPNGAAFSVRDLVAPDIIERLRLKLGINKYDDLVKAIEVTPSSPFLDGLNRKYEDLLRQKNLTVAETEKINTSFQNEVNQFSSRGALISINSTLLGVGSLEGKRIALQLPETWNQLTLEKYNVINDKFLAYIDIPGQFRKFDSSLNIMQTEKYLESISSGLSAIVSDARLLSVKSQNGKTVADVKADVSRFTEIYFYPIFLFYNKKEELIYNAYLEEIRLAVDEVDTKIKNLDVVISDVKQQRNEATGTVGDHTSKSRDILDIGENSIGAIVSLANKASMSDYLKEVFEKRAALVAEKPACKEKMIALQSTLLMLIR